MIATNPYIELPGSNPEMSLPHGCRGHQETHPLKNSQDCQKSDDTSPARPSQVADSISHTAVKAIRRRMIRALSDNFLIKFEVSAGFKLIAPLHLRTKSTPRVVLFHLCEFLTLAACFPSALRILFGKCFKVCFRFAALTAFLMFFRAALRCLRLAINSSLKVVTIGQFLSAITGPTK